MSAARPETGATDADEGTTPEGENVVWAFFRNTFFRRIWPIPEMKKDEAECERFTNELVAELRSSGFVIALAEHVWSAADREAIGRVAQRLPELRSYFVREYVRGHIYKAQGKHTTADEDRWCEEAERRWDEANPSYADDLAVMERLGSGGEAST